MSKSSKERRSMVKKRKQLSKLQQCELLSVSRSSVYYKPKPESQLNQKLMVMVDEKHMLHPWLGVSRITKWLREDKGIRVNKKRIERLFKMLDIQAIGPKPNTSKKGKGSNHRTYPYLLKGLTAAHPNHVWGMDITYIPIQGGHLYLNAIIDLYSRFVVGWSLSNTMTSDWCIETVKKAIEHYGKPEILNTDQGSQFTANEFCNWLEEPSREIKISMDGKGRAIDNIFIERLWRSVKHEHVYLHPADDGLMCYKGLKKYFEYYNKERRHQSLAYLTPHDIYIKMMNKVA